MNNTSIGSTDNGFDESVSIAVVTAVSTRRGVAPTELPPLYEWIDPDALDALFKPTRRGGPRCGELEFTYDGHEITVTHGDYLEIAIDGTLAAEPATVAADTSRPGV